MLSISAIALLASCGGGTVGELVGVSQYDGWTPITPFGMNYIHMGSYTMGNNDDDIAFAHSNRAKTISLASFYIDDTEITNTEYRQFVEAVSDSVARSFIAENVDEFKIVDDDKGTEILNYDVDIDYSNEEQAEALTRMYIQDDEQYYSRAGLDPRVLNYQYYWVDFKDASNKPSRSFLPDNVNSKGESRPVLFHDNRAKYIVKEIINIYPDTLVWIADFVGSYNEMMTENYFWHPAYDDYPLVGVTWSQARAFNVWRTRLMNNWKSSRGDLELPSFRLPSEAEWEYAARGGLELSQYPWGGPYLRNRLGCPLANYKPLRGDYVDDGGLFTVKVQTYEPNDYGLYEMAGNVAEWTNTSYDPTVYEFASELNPEYNYDAKKFDRPERKRKVIRGGSWKDVPYFLQCGTRSFEYQDTAKAYIGFRSVMSYLGRGQDPKLAD